MINKLVSEATASNTRIQTREHTCDVTSGALSARITDKTWCEVQDRILNLIDDDTALFGFFVWDEIDDYTKSL